MTARTDVAVTIDRWPTLVLASASPRRRDLLRAIGVEPIVHVPPDDVELPWNGESPEAHVRAQARAKAEAVAPHVDAGVVLGADTIVLLDGHVLEKPRDARDAEAMLRRLSGRTHRVLTAIALAPAGTARAACVEVETTAVVFDELRDEDILAYVATGEPLDKAGAYAIQGRAAVFVRKIDGCYFNVVGLPVPLLFRMLRELSQG